MKMNTRNRGGFTLVELLVVIAIIAALAGLTAPMIIRQRKKADQTQAVNNAHQIGIAMFEFEGEYGSFPDGDAAFIKKINDNKGTGGVDATAITTSNDAFKQLFAAGMTTSEEMFFCKTGYSTVKPDNVATTGTECLKKGEVGFSYIMGPSKKAYSLSGNSGRVLASAPVLASASGTLTNKKFDKGPYDSKAVFLKMDNSVVSLPINNSNDVMVGGVNVFNSGVDTVWGVDAPEVVDPLPK